MRAGSAGSLAAWENVWLPLNCARDRVSVIHAPTNWGLPLFSRPARVLTLHDAIDHAVGERLQWRMRLRHWIARTRAHRLITVSEFSKQDIVARLGVAPTRIAVIPEAAETPFHDVPPRSSRDRPYMFYVGGFEGRKNIGFLIEAFATARVPGIELVLAGGNDSDRDRVTAFARDLGVGDSVRWLGWVDDSELARLYAGALAFVYPSRYEGFGLQVCEALAAGCPVLAARATSLPEVLGDGGATFSLDGTGELTSLLRRVATEAPFRQELVSRGRARAAAFSWRRTAEMTLSVYREVA